MALVENRDVLEPLDFLVAGPSVLFMFLDLAFYWIIVFLFETKFFAKLKYNLCGGRRERE